MKALLPARFAGSSAAVSAAVVAGGWPNMERPGPSDGGFSEASTCRMGRAGRAALVSPSDKAFSLFSFSNDRLRRLGTRPAAGGHHGLHGVR